MDNRIEYLIVDTSAFIRNVPLQDIAKNILTIQDVINEVTSKPQIRRLVFLPYDLKVKEPFSEDIKFVTEFSKKTGDYPNLSATDIKVVALTYMLEKQELGTEHLKEEPNASRTVTFIKPKIDFPTNIAGFYMPPTGKGSGDVCKNENSQRNSCQDIDAPTECVFSDLELQLLNSFLADHSYLVDYQPSRLDFLMVEVVSEFQCTEYPHLDRWYKHIQSFQSELGDDYLNIKKLCEMGLDGKSDEDRLDIQSFIRYLQDTEGETEVTSAAAESSHHPVSGKNQQVEENPQREDSDEYEEEEYDDETVLKFLEGSGVNCVPAEDARDQITECTEQNMLGRFGSKGEEEEGYFEGEEYSEEDEGSSDEDYDEEADDDGWITPENIAEIRKQMKSLTLDENPVTVACVTTDFAMQNVLKQIGLNVVSIDGKLIRETRTFILRCYACFKTTSIMTKVFCPTCGNKTLKRVSLFLDEDGNQKIFISCRKAITGKGKRFSLPMPKTGKHANNPIRTEDQRVPQQHPSRLARTKNDPLNDDYIAGYSPFVMRDVNSRAARLGIYGKDSGYWTRKNPNEVKNKKRRRK